MSAIVISPQLEATLKQQLEDANSAMFAARLDQALRRGGAGAAVGGKILRHDVHGGELHVFKAALGNGMQPPTHAELEAELGEGFGDFLRKAKKHGLTLAGHAFRAGKEIVGSKAVKDAAMNVGKAALQGAAAGHAEGGIKGALRGGIAGAADVGKNEAASIARAEAQRRIMAAMM